MTGRPVRASRVLGSETPVLRPDRMGWTGHQSRVLGSGLGFQRRT